MPRYIVLENFTDQGIKGYRESSSSRIEASTAAIEKMGARIAEVYWTPMGPYDIVSIIDAPDDETISAILLNDASKGNIRPLIMRAFDREEMNGIVERTPGS